jgi:hypothetical protein
MSNLLNGAGSSIHLDISGPSSLELAPSKQFALVVDDGEFTFYASEISQSYLESLWMDKSDFPRVRALLVDAMQLAQITDKPSFTSPLMDDSYLILVSDTQLRESLAYQLKLISLDISLKTSDDFLLETDKELKNLASTLGVIAPKLICDDKILGVV